MYRWFREMRLSSDIGESSMSFEVSVFFFEKMCAFLKSNTPDLEEAGYDLFVYLFRSRGPCCLPAARLRPPRLPRPQSLT